MGYLPIAYVQLQRSVSCSDCRCLKLVREIKVSNFSDFCNSFQSQAAENWNERRPNEVLALGMISEIHLLEMTTMSSLSGQVTVTSWNSNEEMDRWEREKIDNIHLGEMSSSLLRSDAFVVVFYLFIFFFEFPHFFLALFYWPMDSHLANIWSKALGHLQLTNLVPPWFVFSFRVILQCSSTMIAVAVPFLVRFTFSSKNDSSDSSISINNICDTVTSLKKTNHWVQPFVNPPTSLLGSSSVPDIKQGWLSRLVPGIKRAMGKWKWNRICDIHGLARPCSGKAQLVLHSNSHWSDEN